MFWRVYGFEKSITDCNVKILKIFILSVNQSLRLQQIDIDKQTHEHHLAVGNQTAMNQQKIRNYWKVLGHNMIYYMF